MQNSTALTELPSSATVVSAERRKLRYGLVVAISAVLHFAAWQFTGALQHEAEPKPKPVHTLEVSLTAPPKPVPSPKGSEPEPKKIEPVSAPPKVSVPSKPAVPPRMKSPPKPKPAAVPKPAPKPESPPPPENTAPAKPEAPPAHATEPSPEPLSRYSDRPGPPAETRNLSNSPEHREVGKAEESARADYLHNPKPEYPAVAKYRHWEGRVVLRVRVLADGSCGQAAVQQSSGHEVLDASALEAVREWRFVPAKRNGQPVESWVNVPINFNLE
jgi:protein TonB